MGFVPALMVWIFAGVIPAGLLVASFGTKMLWASIAIAIIMGMLPAGALIGLAQSEKRRKAEELKRLQEEAERLKAERQAQETAGQNRKREEAEEARQATERQVREEKKREKELLQRMEDLNDLLWTAENGVELPFGLKSIEEVAKEIRRLLDANPTLKERYQAQAKERNKRRYEARLEAERQTELQADLWQGTGGPPKPGRNWIRRTWPNEARDFTPWIARNLELVSACTGLDLCCEGVEIPIPLRGRADIVARDNKSRSKVVIENQLDAADFAHAQQLSAYGDGLDARIRIWIAADFRSSICRDARDQNRLSESRAGGAIYYLLKLRPDRTSPISLAVGPRLSVTNSPHPRQFTQRLLL